MSHRTPAVALSWAVLSGCTLLTPPAAAQGPGSEGWRQHADPADAGWSAEGLESARAFADELGSAAVFVVQNGVVVAAWGAVDHPYRLASMRKSVYSLLFGIAEDRGQTDLDATLADLAITDLQPLTATEQRATVRDLMSARSGVYLPAAYETESNAERRPDRGSAAPGEQWYYNNWDFNALPTIFRRQTGRPIAEAFADDLAEPLAFEDFVPSRDTFDWLEPSVSEHSAALFRLSARDTARLGQLLLNDGQWNGRRIVSPDWIDESTSPVTVFPQGHYRGAGNGYGYMWWLYPADPASDDPWQRLDRIAASGAGGQAMFIVPELELVIVHYADTDRTRGVGDRQGAELMSRIVRSRTGTPRADTALVPVEPRPLRAGNPAPIPERRPVPESTRDAGIGRYTNERGEAYTLFEHNDRLFARREGDRIAEAELFLDASGASLFSPVAPVVISIDESQPAPWGALRARIFGRDQVLTRTDEK